MADYFPFDPNPRHPSTMPPAKACDSQFHVMGPRDVYPPRPGAGYEMPSATWDVAMKMHKALGIERGLIVQPTTYGVDNRCMLDTLAKAGPNYKGCCIAAVFSEPDAEKRLAELNDKGVRGARFNFLKQLNMMPSESAFRRIMAQIKELGWFAKMQAGYEGILEFVNWFEDITDVPIIIDHMGRANPAEGPKGATVQKIVELLKKGNFWIMVSNGHKISKVPPPWDDVRPLARAFLEAAPERVIWSTDWPHPLSKTQPPNDAELLELLYRYTDDDTEIHNILVRNPAEVFGFK